ncbi:hypothetical protein SAMN04488490_3855 [Marinobacter sp. LV10R510-11A]|nr:hypothetical protein SAMN04488490_3855 [Marinobacter sp. LV10R510-11A]
MPGIKGSADKGQCPGQVPGVWSVELLRGESPWNLFARPVAYRH